MTNNLPIITIPLEQLSSRVSIVQKTLRPLVHCNNEMEVPCKLLPKKQDGGKVIAAHGKITRLEDYRDWKFRTLAKDIWCQYFEIWKPTNDEKEFYLFRAYLHLFQTDRSTHSMKEFVCVHCDPEEVQNRYKQGPHLHIKNAEEPIPQCHFPLNYCNLDTVLYSIDTLTESIEKAIEILTVEVVNRYI